MSVSYNRLWKLLIDKKMSQSELRKEAGIAPNTMTKLRRDEAVNLAILGRICDVLDCDFGDIMEHKCMNDNKREVLPERDIDTNDIADYLMRSIDGFLDVVEIKRPDLQFWAGPDSHGNYYPTAQLTAAISQCLNYLYRIELQSNSVEFMERIDGTKTVKPQCMLVYGRSNDWGEDKMRALRILNAAYHQLHIITYDQLLLRAKQLLGFSDQGEDEEDYDFLPF